MADSASAVLAAWSSALTIDDLPAPVRAAARRHLLDGLGCLVAGLRRGEAPAALTVAAGLGGPPEATLFAPAFHAAVHSGGGDSFGETAATPGSVAAVSPKLRRLFPEGGALRLGAASAALGNAVAMHALDFDDTHAGGLVHATTVTAPVALAVAEQVGATGPQLLTAYVAGLETVCRLGLAAPHAFHGRGLHATSVCGVIAAAVVTARLLELPAGLTRHAIGIAASGAGGLLEFLHGGASTKQLHPGFAAHAGVVAARLAAAGATGPGGGLDGAHGLFAALADRAPDGDALLADLGVRWEATRIGVKPYPACQLSHAAVDAARELRAGGDVSSIVDVEVRVHPDAAAIVCREGMPDSAYGAKFSLAWSVAAMLLDGELGVGAFDAPHRPDVVALARRVRPVVTDFGGAAADQPGRLAATLSDGTVLLAEVPRSGGGPDDPAVEQVVRAKAVANLGEPGERAVRAAVAGLENDGSGTAVPDLIDAVRRSLA